MVMVVLGHRPTKCQNNAEMTVVSAATFTMGSDDFYPEERPAHRVAVETFALDLNLVTNRKFAVFVDATAYVTVAERPFSHLGGNKNPPGSLVFRPTAGPVDLGNWRNWWAWMPGAFWREPFGPGSDVEDKKDHPVVHVCFADAVAYAAWAGKRLPTESEWECAARGGLERKAFAWGDDLRPNGRLMANYWQGSFPYRYTGAAGWSGTSPIASFPANEFGLFDMIGNVWEWTSSKFSGSHATVPAADGNIRAQPLTSSLTGVPWTGDFGDGCKCGPSSRAVALCSASSFPVPDPDVRRVTKGGSHLCAPEYCQRYRPASRSPQTEDSATSHTGFRCAADIAVP